MITRDQLRYHHLTKEQISNPLVFVEYFCRCDIDIEGLRIELLDMIRSACSSKKYGNPENYFHYHRCLLQFLEVGHIFFRRRKQFSIVTNLTACTSCTTDLSKDHQTLVNSHFKNLSKEEIRNTSCFFRDFFAYKTLNDWRDIFSRIVEYAYRTTTIDEILEEGAEMVIVKEYIEKLIEVIYLIDNIQSFIYLQNTASMN